MRATSASQRTDNSYAFLSKPLRLLQKVTWRLVVFSIRLISIFPLPIFFWGETDIAWFGNAMIASWNKKKQMKNSTRRKQIYVIIWKHFLMLWWQHLLMEKNWNLQSNFCNFNWLWALYSESFLVGSCYWNEVRLLANLGLKRKKLIDPEDVNHLKFFLR